MRLREVLVEKVEKILEEGVARSIDFEKVTELFNASYKSSWHNKHYRGLRFDKGYVEVMSQAKFRVINVKKLKPTTYKYFLKLLQSNFYGDDQENLMAEYEMQNNVAVSFFMDETQVFLKFFNQSESNPTSIDVFNVNTKKFKELATKAKFDIVPSKDIKYDLKSMKYNSESNQIEIALKDNIIINNSNYSKEEAPKNTLTIRKSQKGTGFFANFLTIWQSDSPKTSEDKLAQWLKDHIKGFKMTEFRKLIKFSLGDVYENSDTENAVPNATLALKSAMNDSGANSDIENGVGTISIKRWGDVSFEFDLDNVVAADWTISRTLTDKSIKYINDLIAKIEKQFKNKITIDWETSEKWHISFTIRKK